MIKSINKNKQTAYGITDAGKVRSNNEDYFYFKDTFGLYIVADGMGGHNSGEVASEETVLFLKNELTEEQLDLHKENIGSFVSEKLLEAHNHIIKIAEEKIEHQGMGCTIVIMLRDADNIHAWHVGDARIYHIHKQNIVQIGTDHSYVAEMVQKGLMTKEEAWESDFKNKITMAIGAPVNIVPEYICEKVNKGDKIILCSDGLNDMLQDDEIKEIALEKNSAKKITKLLLEEALFKGGKDNITIITHIVE